FYLTLKKKVLSDEERKGLYRGYRRNPFDDGADVEVLIAFGLGGRYGRYLCVSSRLFDVCSARFQSKRNNPADRRSLNGITYPSPDIVFGIRYFAVGSRNRYLSFAA